MTGEGPLPSAAQIEAAEGYEALLVPALFEHWVPVVLDRANVGPGDRVLDVACGTGVLARGAVERAGPGGQVTGLDPAPGMIEVARRLEHRVEWRSGMAEELPFADGSFDAVVSQFGLMFFDDRATALREVRRVLGMDGRVAFAVWDRLDRNPAYEAEVALIEQRAGARAAELVSMPFSFGDAQALAELAVGAGLQGVSVEAVSGRGRFPSVAAMLEADLRGWLPLVGLDLSEERIADVLDGGAEALAHYVVPGGAVEFETSALILSARAS